MKSDLRCIASAVTPILRGLVFAGTALCALVLPVRAAYADIVTYQFNNVSGLLPSHDLTLSVTGIFVLDTQTNTVTGNGYDVLLNGGSINAYSPVYTDATDTLRFEDNVNYTDVTFDQSLDTTATHSVVGLTLEGFLGDQATGVTGNVTVVSDVGVPEPASIALLGVAMVALRVARRGFPSA